ncbi:MAG TPA: tetratricopeptide repeat protein [Bryobacteraceae bacterium]|nr:tetratricopeptide repeat protein [Bryobacteraceae bacterium]
MSNRWLVIGGLVASLLGAEPETLLENGHLKRAREAVDAYYRAHPQDARANYLMSRVTSAFGDNDNALKYAETAVKLDPRNGEYHRQLAGVYGDIGEKASLLKQFGLAKKCRAEIDAAVALNPKDVENLDAQVNYYRVAPGIAGGDKNKAQTVAEEMVKINPSRGYLAEASIARAEKDDAKAAALYRKAVDADPRNYEALISLTVYYMQESHKDLAQAERLANDAIGANPDRISAYVLAVQILVKQNRSKEAPALLAKAEAAIPDNLVPYLAAGRALLEQGSDLQTAETYIRKYLTQTPEPGWPPLAGAHWSLALLHEKRGDKPQARTELETALRLKPDFEPAKRDLKRLK